MKNRSPKNGIVYLVGAGPGDAGLITVRAMELLRAADAVVYDGLVNPSLLQLSLSSEKIYAGKKTDSRRNSQSSHHEYVDQNHTNRLLVKLARQGKNVVRLKGGDPFIFGRGGEEGSYLKKAGIRFEVVPGVTAGYAAPAYAGIPVTDRRFASFVTFVTAHENPAKPETAVDWKALARLQGTLVIFMGIKNLGKITQKLIEYGQSPKTLASVIEWGTLPAQKVVSGKLSEIAGKAKKAKLASPAVTVIGQVNALRKELDWYRKPLSGKTVLVTRARSQASVLKTQLEQKGADVIEFPVIDILPPADWNHVDHALRNFETFDWIVFTSTNGVESFFNRLKALKKDARIFSGKKIAVIGEATGEVLEKYGLTADLIPEAYTSEALIAALKKIPLRGHSFLLARTDIAPGYLREELLKRGAEVQDLVVYRTAAVEEKARKKQLEKWVGKRKIDFVTFTSSSTVKNFFEALAPALRKKLRSKLISIGPVTSGTLKEYGFKPYREARIHTIPGLVEAMIQ